MFNEMIFDKKIDLAATVLESAITNAENMDNIIFMESVDDFYMESEKLDKIKEGTKKFFDTIITAIKEFFEKIQNAIKEKINNAKINKAVDDIKKSGIKDLRKIKVKGVNEKTLKKYYEDTIKIVADGTKKILKAKSTEEIMKYCREVDEKIERIERTLEVEKVNGEFMVDAYGDVLMTKTMDSISDLSSGTLKNLKDLCIEQRAKIANKEFADTANAIAEEMKKRKEEKEKQEEEARLAAEKEKALKKQASIVSRVTKKIGSALSTTQGKVIAGVVAAGAVAAGAVGVKKINDSKSAKKNQPSSDTGYGSYGYMSYDDFNYKESVDDIIDSLFEDVGV